MKALPLVLLALVAIPVVHAETSCDSVRGDVQAISTRAKSGTSEEKLVNLITSPEVRKLAADAPGYTHFLLHVTDKTYRAGGQNTESWATQYASQCNKVGVQQFILDYQGLNVPYNNSARSNGSNAAGEVASFLLEVVALPFLAGAAEGRANRVKPRESYTCMHAGLMTNCTKDY